MTIGDNIKNYRKKAGLTQKKLGELSGTSESTIKQYELGKRQPRLEQLRKISAALNIPFGDLIPFDDGLKLWKNERQNRNYTKVQHDSKESEQLQHHHADTIQGTPNFMKKSNYERLIDAYSQLNIAGEEKVIEQAELIAKIPEYRNN